MGETELKIALQQEGASHIRAIWQEAEAVVEKRRRMIDTELEQLRDETDRHLQAELADLRSSLLFEAQVQAMACRLRAEDAVGVQLLALAETMLRDLAGAERTRLWSTLAAELPASPWATLTVHPEDQDLARQAFPDVTIQADETLAGGLVASNADATVTIDNSLSCRLRRAWPDLLPKLMADLRKLVDNHETARHDTTR